MLKLPADPFSPFIPSEDVPWDLPRVNHLLRRCGFGPTHEKIDELLALSPAQAVESLFSFDSSKDPFAGMIEQLEGFVRLNDGRQATEWWVFRMINTPQPLQERIALMWHNHFATSLSKVGSATRMLAQIELFRRQGLGSFRDLLISVARDPAMLVWLDGQTNRKGKANENFGREVMELFTLGVGNYTEQDVKELARAFTGWRIEGDASVFQPNQCDSGEKTILGETGKFDSESAVDLLLRQPAAPKFLAARLLREFLHPQPTQDQIDHYAGRLIETKWSIGQVLREMVSSRLFFSEWAYRSKIKSPADLCIGAVRAINAGGGKASTEFVSDNMRRMGQQLLYPPTVKGWPGEEEWINASTVLQRFNFGQRLASQRDQDFTRRTNFTDWLKKHDVKSAEDVIEYYARVLLDGQLTDKQRSDLLNYMNLDEKGAVKPFELNERNVNAKGKGLLHLMMAMPEYQLC